MAVPYDRRAVALFSLSAHDRTRHAAGRSRTVPGGEPTERCFMAYESIWARLKEATEQVMDAAGCSKEEAQADICRAFADGVIRFRARLKEHNTNHMRSKTVLEGTAFEMRHTIRPADLDWERSCPLKPWMVGRGKYSISGPWNLDWIEVSRADIESIFGAGGQARGAAPLPAAKTNSHPKMEAARRAIKSLYPSGPPDQVALPNKDLVWQVSEKLKELKLPVVKADTIYRAAGRRRK